MLCPRCKREIPDDSSFCCYCARVIVPKPKSNRHTRANGTGSVCKRGKNWTAIVTVGWELTKDNRRRQLVRTKGGFKTRTEALEYLPTLKSGSVKRNAPALEHYWRLYENGEYQKLSDSKQTAYRIAWKKLSSLRLTPIDALTVYDLRRVVGEKASTYYPAHDMKVVLSHLFKLAAADRWADKDLPEFIILPEKEETERKPFTADEQAALWRLYESGDRRAAMPLVMIYTGMMPGEMKILKREMVHLDENRIIGASIKTKVRRASPIYLPDAIVPVMDEQMHLSADEEGYIFPHTDYKFYTAYYGALEAAACRRLEPYSCRHTTATALAITEGIAPQTIKKVMRWSTTKMLDRYAHPDDDAAIAALNVMGKPPVADAPDRALDVAGQRFGRLLALERTDKKYRTCYIWRCRCDCGKDCEVPVDQLRAGAVRSCGCLQDETRRTDITGQKRGHLTAICATDAREEGHTVWKWRCDCGREVLKTPHGVGEGKSTMCPDCAFKLKGDTGRAALERERDESTGLLPGSIEAIRQGKLISTNTSGVRGVNWHAGTQSWAARIYDNGKTRTIGYFHTIEEAAEARRRAVIEKYGASPPPTADPHLR